MEAERIPERARHSGERVAARFREWGERYPCIGDVRGLGAMVGMELVTDRDSRSPDKALTTRLLTAALERGLILLSAGTYGNTVRVLAPLTAEDAVIEEGLAVLEESLAAVVGSPALAEPSRQVL
jgi:4-aminobutyrate aminotransferase/(S)-3-amino-2-methylpropionate transaminase